MTLRSRFPLIARAFCLRLPRRSVTDTLSTAPAMDMGAQAPVPELRGPKVGKSSAPGAADTQMALLARLSLFDRVDAG